LLASANYCQNSFTNTPGHRQVIINLSPDAVTLDGAEPRSCHRYERRREAVGSAIVPLRMLGSAAAVSRAAGKLPETADVKIRPTPSNPCFELCLALGFRYRQGRTTTQCTWPPQSRSDDARHAAELDQGHQPNSASLPSGNPWSGMRRLVAPSNHLDP
jgi:hypothetical protein